MDNAIVRNAGALEVKLFLPGIIIAFILANSVSALNNTVQVFVFDLNTRGGISGANITIMNHHNHTGGPHDPTPLNFSVYTDVWGTASFNEVDVPVENYTMAVEHDSYIPFEKNMTVGASDKETVYMYPSSSAGIIRIRFQDRTILAGEGREICVFFKENGRLYGCFAQNETMQLLTQKEYVFQPTIEAGDMISSPRNIGKAAGIYSGAIIIGGSLIIAIMATIIYMLIGRKK